MHLGFERKFGSLKLPIARHVVGISILEREINVLW